jgi:hypothetical protein
MITFDFPNAFSTAGVKASSGRCPCIFDCPERINRCLALVPPRQIEETDKAKRIKIAWAVITT